MTHQLPRTKSRKSRSPSISRSRSTEVTFRDLSDNETLHERSPDFEKIMRSEEDILATRPPSTPSLQVLEDHQAMTRSRKSFSSTRSHDSPKLTSSPAGNRSRSLRVPHQRRSNRIPHSQSGSNIPAELITDDKHKTAFNHSLSVPGDVKDFHRLRNFSVTSKGIINRGDSFRSRSSSFSQPSSPQTPPTNEFFPPDSTQLQGTQCNSSLASSASSPGTSSASASSTSDSSSPFRYRVWIMGSPGVGKSSLKHQFMTSEHICQYDNWQDDVGQRIVAIVVDGEESELEFVECSGPDDKLHTETSNPDAYIIVYSVTNRRSYLQARSTLTRIETSFGSKAVILVGNKTDLARLRTVTTVEGRSLAKERGCKFIETSIAINHQVDELLVGVLTQIRIKAKIAEKKRKKQESRATGANWRSSYHPGTKATGIIKRLLRRTCMTSKSCDNLHSL